MTTRTYNFLAALFCGAALSLLTANARAETAVTLESAVAMAMERNPELRAARAAIAEAEARLAGAGKLANPEFELEAAAGPDEQNRVEVGLSQKLPVTARLRLEKELSRLDLATAQAEVAVREWEIAGATRLAVIRHIAAREALALNRAQVDAARKMADFTAERAREGQSSSLEAGTAALENRRLQAALATLELEQSQAAADLATLLGFSAPDDLTTSGTLNVPAALPTKSGNTPPTTALAEAGLLAGRHAVALAEAQRWEDIGIGVFVERERTLEDAALERETFAGIRVSMPLPLWNSGDAAVREKTAASQRLEAELEAARIKAANIARAAHSELRQRHRIALELNGELAALARQQVADYEAAYGRGEIGFDEVYRARERLMALESAALDARRDYHLAHARWLSGLAHE